MGEEAAATREGPVDDGDLVWEGAAALRPFLVPIDGLEPFPGNPRVGDVEACRASLRRFGQTRAILTMADRPDRVVAGHHFRLAAVQEGWTHIAAIPNEFPDEEEARAYLLADNRTHDLGGYDTRLLVTQLDQLRELEQGLAGTGYDEAHVALLRRDLELMDARTRPPAEFPPLDPRGLTVDYCCPSCGYEWSGDPAPGRRGRDDGENGGEGDG